ncbi:hypothetical protein WOLCODRAFT_66376 [Wolfiporia cocos MD-104 SS10]|uniref:Uncharacterized protein n=1 Tax=Wolfiporia cocos (strain MD-104) TaxID=742152 RepID=A0A2H3J967_WOLCO|nr:hypothetical protein WOLCODRAFT_66376 [Wolfiporia cocos MD-104 SS10]
MDNSADAANSLGLDLDALEIKDDPEPSGSSEPPAVEASAAPAEQSDAARPAEITQNTSAEEEAKSPTSEGNAKEKKKPYVNPERVKTGGAQRDKLSEQELTERMARIREQNERIKQRRADVQADEDAFKKTQEADRIKAAKTKKVQENIDRTREQNARRKMEKIQGREWDSGKPTQDWKPARRPEEGDDADRAPRASIGIRGAFRGGAVRGRGGRGRGRGRGRMAAQAPPTERLTEESPAVTTPAAAAS